MIEQLGGRKFLFAVGVTLLASGFVFARLLPVAEWLKFVEIIGTIYVVGNVGSAVAEKLP